MYIFTSTSTTSFILCYAIYAAQSTLCNAACCMLHVALLIALHVALLIALHVALWIAPHVAPHLHQHRYISTSMYARRGNCKSRGPVQRVNPPPGCTLSGGQDFWGVVEIVSRLGGSLG